MSARRAIYIGAEAGALAFGDDWMKQLSKPGGVVVLPFGAVNFVEVDAREIKEVSAEAMRDLSLAVRRARAA